MGREDAGEGAGRRGGTRSPDQSPAKYAYCAAPEVGSLERERRPDGAGDARAQPVGADDVAGVHPDAATARHGLADPTTRPPASRSTPSTPTPVSIRAPDRARGVLEEVVEDDAPRREQVVDAVPVLDGAHDDVVTGVELDGRERWCPGVVQRVEQPPAVQLHHARCGR